ncbi:unnamed protein product [Allacma fusca]|uniref:Uncharacterized protein n=1 Tax=Allacma fusca TaxID=39272 RepID=A0A8J2JXP7_9HEXA|nr:unnamed protein product [Allacma fusca]
MAKLFIFTLFLISICLAHPSHNTPTNTQINATEYESNLHVLEQAVASQKDFDTVSEKQQPTNSSVTRHKKQALAAIASIGSRILESITPTAAGGFLAHIKALFGGTPQTFLQRVGHGKMDLEKTGPLVF